MSLIEINRRRKWCLIGIEDHQAVHHLGGRIGSALGPSFFWNIFKKMRGKEPIFDSMENFYRITSQKKEVIEIHEEVITKIEAAHRNIPFSVIIGGSHDHGYTHLTGIKKSLKKNLTIGCINIDAHFDVRKPDPEISSGSPFYLALENKILDPKNFIEFGIQSHCNSKELWEYIEKKKVKTYPFDQLRNNNAVKKFDQCLKALSKKTDVIVISFDLDACDESHAPGVSAPQAEGLNSREIIDIMEICGKNPKVISLGIFELNPLHDSENKTSRLAATCAFHFLENKIRKKA